MMAYSETFGPELKSLEEIGYNFTDPATYRGPQVKGWPPSRSREVALYIKPFEDTVLNDITCLDLRHVKVLIIVQSAPTKIDRRNKIRERWMRFQVSFPLVKTVFLFGTETKTKAIKAKPHDVEAEQAEFCDVVQMDFVDSYENVTLDTISALKFARTADFSPFGPPDYVVIADDDTYINVPKLWSLLYEDDVITPKSDFLMGFKFITSQVLKIENRDRRDRFVGHLITPSYMYDGDFYPDSMSGSAYVLPAATLTCLYQSSVVTPLFHINDIHVSAFAAERCGYERKHNGRFQPGQPEPQNLRPDTVSVHWCTGKCQDAMHVLFKKQNGDMSTVGRGRYVVIDNEIRVCRVDGGRKAQNGSELINCDSIVRY